MTGFTPQEEEINKKEEALAIERKILKAKTESIIQEKTDIRIEDFCDYFELFKTTKSKDTQDSIYINLVLLKSAIISYYNDIYRYKDFSGSKLANKFKQAAYTIKWLVRFRPIQILEKRHISEEIFDINITFALICGFSFLDPKMVDLIMTNKLKVDLMNKTKKEEEKEKSFYDKLIYDLRYRHLSGKKLLLAFEAIELAFD